MRSDLEIQEAQDFIYLNYINHFQYFTPKFFSNYIYYDHFRTDFNLSFMMINHFLKFHHCFLKFRLLVFL